MADTAMPIGNEELLHDLCHDTVGCMSRLYRHHGPVVAFPKGTDQTVFAFGPEANYAVYSDPATYQVYGPPGPRNSAQRRFGQGLFGLNGARQQQHRRLLLPALNRPAAAAHVQPMLEIIEGTLAGWRTGQRLDLAAAMKELALRIAGRLLFGLEDFSDAAEVAGAFQAWLDDYVRVNFAQTLPLDLPAGHYREWLAAGERLEGTLRRLIGKRQDTLRDGQHDLLALLLRAQQAGQISEAEVVGEVQTLLNASYQTTAAGLTWTLLLLAQHPVIARDVLAEQAPDRPPEPGRAALLERVIKESLRVLPPVVFVIRRSVRATRLVGHAVREGTVVVLSLYVTHHMAELFPEPEQFDPDRWLVQKPSPYAYVPFGAGARMCLGALFSMQLFQLAIPAILRRFRLELAAGTRVDRHSSLTMGVKGALPVTLAPQDGRLTAVPLAGNIHEMVRLPNASEMVARPAVRAA